MNGDAPNTIRSSVFTKLVRSTALAVAGVFALVALLSLWQADRALTRALDAQIDDDVAAFVELHALTGSQGLSDAMTQRLALIPSDRPQAYYLFTGADGAVRSGNLALDGTLDLPLSEAVDAIAPDGRLARLRATRLRGNDTLVVGRSLDRAHSLLWRLALIFALGVVLATGLTAWLGGQLAHALRHRVDAINAVLARVGQGHADQRIGDEASDEIGLLARQTDRTLERLGHLLTLRQRVTDQVAHEMRSPLTRLDQVLQTAAESPGDAAAIDAARSEVGGCVALLDHLLDVSALDAQKGDRRSFERLDLAALVRDLGELYEAVAEDSGRDLKTSVPSAPVWMEGDPAQLGRLIANLLDNAVKYSSSGTTINLTLEAAREVAIVRVANDGPPIEGAMREDIFVPFVRAGTGDANGYGLGLALCRSIAARHDGTIAVEPGARTVFRVDLPMAKD